MKKSLLSFFMLVMFTGIISTQTSAQEVGGGSADGLVPVDPMNPAAGYQAAPDFQPPSFSLTLRRNNGNGHCIGSAIATLNVKGTWSGQMWLTGIAHKSNGQELPSVTQGDGLGTQKSNNITFCLNYNVPPKNKLIFKFEYQTVGGATGSFWIPEM